jgi:diguanylate cyclase (GGDEF)-like protein/PAS domain S-box-containing protein
MAQEDDTPGSSVFIQGSYNYGLVALSVALAVVASYAVSDLAGRISASRRGAKFFWMAVGSVAFGLGIWAMHYIGMLAFRLPVPVLYHFPTVVLSLLVAILISAIALYTVSRLKLNLLSSVVASLTTGGGIAAMHYIGMAAMRLPAMMEYRASLVALSILVGFAVSFASLLLAMRYRFDSPIRSKLGSALFMGSGIPLTHYIGMWAVRFRACSTPFSTKSTLQVSSLGIVVISVTTFLVLLLAILVVFVDRLLGMQAASAQTARDGEAQFRTLAEAIPQIVWTAGPDGQTNYISQRWYETTGMPRGSGTGSNWIEVVHPDDREVCHKKWLECINSGSTFEVEYRLRDSTKNFRWYLDRAVPLRDASGVVKQWFGTCTDIDDKMQNQQLLEREIQQRTDTLIEVNAHLESEMRERALAQQELNLQNERMVKELTRRSNRATTLVKMAHLLQSCDDLKDVFCVVAGMGPKIFPELRGCVMLLNPAQDLLETAASWSECRTPGADFVVQDCWALRTGHMHLTRADDLTAACKHVIAGEYTYFCLPLASQGKSIGVVHFQNDDTEELPETLLLMANMFAEQVGLSVANLRLREALRNQSIRDPLTGLFNRRYLEETLDREVRRATRSQHSLGVLMLDLDHFKKFNDVHGHEAGDSVLRETASFLAASVRAEDVVCRFGGEEFVIILPTADLAAAHGRAEKICSNLRFLEVVHQGQPVGTVTVSVGVAAIPEHGATPQRLLEAADAALYRAKREGRNRVMDATRSADFEEARMKS